jgi:integrase
VKRAGIPRCTLHDLRRTFISHLAMAGVNEAVVKELAGHASISTTLRYYTRIMPQALRSAQARLPFDAVLRDVSDTYHEAAKAAKKKKARDVTPALAVG